jgi:hypothetical protein
MHPRIAMLAPALFVLLPGCAGNVRTIALAPGALAAGSSHAGVVYYEAQYLKLTYAYTARIDEKSGVVGTADARTCVPIVQKEEVALMPDLTRPMLIRNDAGFLSAARFAVSLKNGMLESVNVDPAERVSGVLSASGAVLKELPDLLRTPAAGTAPCNASPRLVAFEKLALK